MASHNGHHINWRTREKERKNLARQLKKKKEDEAYGAALYLP
jgi:hypothetical protein